MSDLSSKDLFSNISALLENARKRVAVAVNQAMVLTYFEICRMIVEDEQKGENRAEYGKALLKGLSLHLTEKFGKGFSEDNLSNMRNFYISYSDKSISETSYRKSIEEKSETMSRISENQISSLPLTDLKISQTKSVNFNLSWSHYLKLIRIKDLNERKFYEIESFKNNWSLRELQRQCDSALYSRLSLEKLKLSSSKNTNGFVTIRFLVNCEGKTGLFRTQQLNENYTEENFDRDFIENLSFTKSLYGWITKEVQRRKSDYYQYLTYKITDGKVSEILP